MTEYPRGTDTTNALTEVRTVLSRAETAWARVEGDPQDEEAAEMETSLSRVVDLLDRWRKTGKPKVKCRNNSKYAFRYCSRPLGHGGLHNTEGIQ